MRRLVSGDLTWDGWAWADEGHFVAQDVVELGEFVDGEFAYPLTDAGDAGVIFEFEGDAGLAVLVILEELVLDLIGMDDHGTKFPDAEEVAASADAFLAEEDGSAVFEFDEQGGDDEDGGEEDQSERGPDDIESAFEGASEKESGAPNGHFALGTTSPSFQGAILRGLTPVTRRVDLHLLMDELWSCLCKARNADFCKLISDGMGHGFEFKFCTLK